MSNFHKCTIGQGIFVTREHVLLPNVAIAHCRNSQQGGSQSIPLSAFEKGPLVGVR